jgi:hypothetical protein
VFVGPLSKIFMLSRNVAYIDANSMSELYHNFRSKRPFLTALFSIIMSIVLPDKEICTVAGSYSFGIFFIYIESIDILIPMFIGGFFMTIAGSYRYDTR